MAVAQSSRLRVFRLDRFGLNSNDAPRLQRFYERAFGCKLVSRKRCGGSSFKRLMNTQCGAECTTLSLGATAIEILQFDDPGRPYHADLSPFDREFQHFAVVVADMQLAFERLAQVEGWTPISCAGPQRLPERSGGVTAFKFRDPDGHPLELLSFPSVRAQSHGRSAGAAVPGIDHSAISITDPQRSLEFYAALGLNAVNRTLNHGIEQQLLDGVSAPVDVIALVPADPTPHVELLHYRGGTPRPGPPTRSQDMAATRLIFDAAVSPDHDDELTEQLIKDPDGHHIHLVPRPQSAAETRPAPRRF